MTEAIPDDQPKTEEDHLAGTRAALLGAGVPHVAFDGWSDYTFALAIEEAGVDPGLARLAFPRGGLDMAIAWHRAEDARLAAALAAEELGGLRTQDRIVHAIMTRLELAAPNREAVRRAAALFALPTRAADGARAIWHTSDTIWTALGDASRDYNWYSKRATLAAVYSAALLYWLGDDTPGASATRAFVRRRIENVMTLEGAKARIRANPIAAAALRLPRRLLDRVAAPADTPPADLPGFWRRKT